MKTQLALPVKSEPKRYYVEYYNGLPIYANRGFFLSFYGRDFDSEYEAKKRAFESFRNTRFDDFDTVALLECNGMQLADKSEPYYYKNAIVRTLCVKKYK
jgi:hypothetical protein